RRRRRRRRSAAAPTSSAAAATAAADAGACVVDRVLDRAALDGFADRVVLQPFEELRPRLRLVVQRRLPQLQVGVEHGDLVVVLILQGLPLLVALVLVGLLLLRG